ncbi:calcium/sodium antiporter [Ilyobacter polytropus]|uniref:Na+/Ca+ antiporter, CaCA family n=1 Tax=Ilyobacter polytropus (strain ATCC 51220 / DSM 2926 / LMG 16218 / CuHBu1) TaxID=572544 RepID=E3H989_ILYPC|nr:calcium/sodium antiporter [Ilyobacter polytropus]ADO82788.1 Na+/Ca+ antiporter, CaCA family [Ilyobacter polytropus DSM 2926]
MQNLIFLLIGFIPLIYGANFLVDGSSSLAKKFNIPNIVIGLTVVAFGTSAPELIVNVFSSLQKTSDITMGNIIGSNIFNIAVILGVTSVLKNLNVKTSTTWKEIPMALMAVVLVVIMINDVTIDKNKISELSRIDGMVLISFFIIFLSYTLSIVKSGKSEEKIEIKEYTVLKSSMLTILGFAMLVIGGKVIVIFAVKLAKSMDISERIIGLTIVSMGTSLPELATSISAALKNNVDIAIGNVVGSNIFNILFVLGISSIIYPIPLLDGVNLDIALNISLNLLLFLFVFSGKGRKVERWEGIFFIMIYILYLAYLIY